MTDDSPDETKGHLSGNKMWLHLSRHRLCFELDRNRPCQLYLPQAHYAKINTSQAPTQISAKVTAAAADADAADDKTRYYFY